MKTSKYLLFSFVLLLSSPFALAVEFETTKLSDSLYMLKGQGGNIAISNGVDGVFIIDDQMAPMTNELMAEIRTISEQAIRFVINTHYHFDHVGGNETIGKTGSVIVAHDNVRKRMTTVQWSNFMQKSVPVYAPSALPDITFNDQTTLHFNGEAVTAYHIANAHTDGDAIIHFPKSNVIHMGDIWFNGLYPYVDLDAGGNIKGIQKAVAKAISLADKGTKIIPGHGPLATLDELKAYAEFIAEATNNIAVLIAENKNLQEIIALKPTAKWDETLGAVWIKPDQFVTMLYNSLMGINEYKQ